MRPLYIKTHDDLGALFGALHAVTKTEFMELGFTEDEWHDGFRKDPLGFVCVKSRHPRGSMHREPRNQRVGALFYLVIEKANVLRGK